MTWPKEHVTPIVEDDSLRLGRRVQTPVAHKSRALVGFRADQSAKPLRELHRGHGQHVLEERVAAALGDRALPRGDKWIVWVGVRRLFDEEIRQRLARSIETLPVGTQSVQDGSWLGSESM